MSSESQSQNARLHSKRRSWNGPWILFARDLVHYVVSSFKPSFNMVKIHDSFRESIPNPFNDLVKNAVKCILLFKHRKKKHTFEHLKSIELSSPIYMKYAEKVAVSYFSEDFNATNFLYFCVDLSVMTTAFIDIGLEEAPDLSVICILKMLECYDTNNDFDKLTSVAEEFPNLTENCFSKAVEKLKENLTASMLPLRELSDSNASDSSEAGDT